MTKWSLLDVIPAKRAAVVLLMSCLAVGCSTAVDDGASSVEAVGKVESALTMSQGRAGHTATLLTDGSLLVAGGGATANAELLTQDGTQTTSVGSLTTNRSNHTAVLLYNGKVLLAGGNSAGTTLSSTELFEPTAKSFAPGPNLGSAREMHTSTLFDDGRVLLVGGVHDFNSYLVASETYDYMSNTTTPVGDLNVPRAGHTASLLQDGRVLVAGGKNGSGSLASCEIFNPTTNTFSTVASMNAARASHTATVLPDGRVLVAGGVGVSALSSAEIYDSSSDKWTDTASLSTPRYLHSATLLPFSRVLITGGFSGSSPIATAEEFASERTWVWETGQRSIAEFWAVRPALSVGRYQHTATLGERGSLLLVGGNSLQGPTTSTEIMMSTARYSTENVALFKPVTATKTIGTASWLTNGSTLWEGDPWDSNGALQMCWYHSWCNPADFGHAIIDLGGLYFVGQLRIQADNNDVYGICGCLDLDNCNDCVDMPTISSGGLRTRSVELDEPWLARYLWVGPGSGDGLFGITEVFAYGGKATASPSFVTKPVFGAPGENVQFSGSGFRGVGEGGGGTVQNSPADHPIAWFNRSIVLESPREYLSSSDWSDTNFSMEIPCDSWLGEEYLTVSVGGVSETWPFTVKLGACFCGEGSACDDEDACTKNDTCDALGTCSGTAFVCTPNQCQESSTCDGKGNCSVVNKPWGVGCDDQNLCTTGDKCLGNGECKGEPKVCNSPPPATCISSMLSRVHNPQGACRRDDGGCEYTYNDITCPSGCNGVTGLCNGDPCAGVVCKTPPNSDCYSLTGDCQAGACTYSLWEGITCGSGNACMANSTCDAAGNCVGNFLPSGTACSDDDPCSRTDACDGQGHCLGTSYTCPAPGQCEASVTCDGAGGCTVSNKPATASCDDSDACTKTDRCDGKGGCQGTIYTCSPGQCDLSASCDGAGGCLFTRKPAGTGCSDANPCTKADQCDGGGNCKGSVYTCPAPDQCQVSVTCDGEGGCTTANKLPGNPCNDQDPCTKADQCDGSGACYGTAYTCPDPGECEVSVACDGAGGCSVTKKTDGVSCTPDALECTADVCAAGTCTHPVKPGHCLIEGSCWTDGASAPLNHCLVCQSSVASFAWRLLPEMTTCDDGDPCTVGDHCNAGGNCEPGAATFCPSPNACEDSVACDGMGGCTVVPMAAGLPCDDLDLCTLDDQCDGAGNCFGSLHPCLPGPCDNTVSCDGLGGCNHVLKAEGAECDDGDPCTADDRCSAEGLCVGTFDNDACQADGVEETADNAVPDEGTDETPDAATPDEIQEDDWSRPDAAITETVIAEDTAISDTPAVDLPVVPDPGQGETTPPDTAMVSDDEGAASPETDVAVASDEGTPSTPSKGGGGCSADVGTTGSVPVFLVLFMAVALLFRRRPVGIISK